MQKKSGLWLSLAKTSVITKYAHVWWEVDACKDMRIRWDEASPQSVRHNMLWIK